MTANHAPTSTEDFAWPESMKIPDTFKEVTLPEVQKNSPKYTELAHNLSRVEDALKYLKPEANDYDKWYQYALAIKHEYGEDGYEVWREWSANSLMYSEAKARKKWNEQKPSGKVSLGTIFHDAKIAGWKDIKFDFNLDYTDVGNGIRFTEKYKHEAIYVRETENWLVKFKHIWKSDHGICAEALAKKIALSIKDESQSCSPQMQKVIFDHSIRSQNVSRLKAILETARSEPEMNISFSELDRDPNLLGMKNVVLDLTTRELIENAAVQYITKSTGIEYDPEAVCIEFIKFIARTFVTDDEQRYIQQVLGYTLLGSNPEKVYFQLYGPRHNGKSTLVSIIVKLLGDYAITTKPQTFMTSRNSIPDGEKAQPELFNLIGKRFVGTDEIPEGKQLNTSLMKSITGNDHLSVRTLHSKPVNTKMQFTLVMHGNHKPVISDLDQAMASRIKLIPMDVIIPRSEWITGLDDKLVESEGSGIFNWLLDGLHMYLDNRKDGKSFDEPVAVTKATREYISDEDLIATWMEQETFITDRKTQVSIAHGNFKDWCIKQGSEPCKQKTFSMRMTDRGNKSVRGTGGFKYFNDLGLQNDFTDVPRRKRRRKPK